LSNITFKVKPFFCLMQCNYCFCNCYCSWFLLINLGEKRQVGLVIQSGFALSGKSSVFYEAAGSGPPVILIHGGCLDRRMWDPQFAPLARYRRVIRYDLTGFGKSPLPEGVYPDLVEDLKVLLEWLNLDRVCLVGLSLGAVVAADFALACPEAVAGLVLAGPGLSGYRFSEEITRTTVAMAEAVRGGDPGRAVEYFVETWVKGSREESPPGVVERVRAIASDYSFCHYLVSPPPVPPPAREPAIGRLGEIKAPTLVLAGDRDQPDILAIADLLVKNIPNARLTVIPGAAHMLNLEQPERFNSELLAFLENDLSR
jgi:pimeloyl-ACP methyl ester carboxylesterase